MTEGGQEFAVKRTAKKIGKGGIAEGALLQIQAKANPDGIKEKKKEVGNKFLNKFKDPSAADAAGEEIPGEDVGSSRDMTTAPLALTDQSGSGNAPAPSTFAQEMRAMAAQAESEAPAA